MVPRMDMVSLDVVAPLDEVVEAVSRIRPFTHSCI